MPQRHRPLLQPLSHTIPSLPIVPITPASIPHDNTPAVRPQRTRQPSQQVRDILAGHSADAAPPRGIQLPTAIVETPEPTNSPSMLEGGHATDEAKTITVDYNDEVELTLALNEATASRKLVWVLGLHYRKGGEDLRLQSLHLPYPILPQRDLCMSTLEAVCTRIEHLSQHPPCRHCHPTVRHRGRLFRVEDLPCRRT